MMIDWLIIIFATIGMIYQRFKYPDLHRPLKVTTTLCNDQAFYTKTIFFQLKIGIPTVSVVYLQDNQKYVPIHKSIDYMTIKLHS